MSVLSRPVGYFFIILLWTSAAVGKYWKASFLDWGILPRCWIFNCFFFFFSLSRCFNADLIWPVCVCCLRDQCGILKFRLHYLLLSLSLSHAHAHTLLPSIFIHKHKQALTHTHTRTLGHRHRHTLSLFLQLYIVPCYYIENFSFSRILYPFCLIFLTYYHTNFIFLPLFLTNTHFLLNSQWPFMKNSVSPFSQLSPTFSLSLSPTFSRPFFCFLPDNFN